MKIHVFLDNPGIDCPTCDGIISSDTPFDHKSKCREISPTTNVITIPAGAPLEMFEIILMTQSVITLGIEHSPGSEWVFPIMLSNTRSAEFQDLSNALIPARQGSNNVPYFFLQFVHFRIPIVSRNPSEVEKENCLNENMAVCFVGCRVHRFRRGSNLLRSREELVSSFFQGTYRIRTTLANFEDVKIQLANLAAQNMSEFIQVILASNNLDAVF